ncbi:MAG: glycosyltransferase [Bacillota bacterium]
MDRLYSALVIIDYLAIVYFGLINSTYLFLNTVAFFSIRKYWAHTDITDFEVNFQSEFYKPVSIIIPAYNEEETIVDNIKSILSLDYPEFEIVVVSDGSKDKTVMRLKEYFNLIPSTRDYDNQLKTEAIKDIYDSIDYPNLVVIDKKNGGKADALNAGINIAQFPLICNIDADSLIDNRALLKIVEPFSRDWRVIAAGGSIRVANDCEIEGGQIKSVKLSGINLVRMQIVEYIRAFLFGRVGWSALKSLLIISGAFGVFRRKHVIAAGGYNVKTVGEDMELVLRMNRKIKNKNRKYRVIFVPDPVCWTQVPEDIKILSNQRRRWQRGLGQSLLLNKELFFNKNYGLLGMLAYPFFFFVEFLGPVVEVIGYFSILLTIILNFEISEVVLLFFITAILMGILLSSFSLLFEELTFRKYTGIKDMLLLFLYSILENFGYKQLHSIWRLRGIIDLFFKRQGWGEQKRKSFNQNSKV